MWYRLAAETGPKISDFPRLGFFFTMCCLQSITLGSSKSPMSRALVAYLSGEELK